VLDTSGEGLRLALEATPQIVKPNIHELEELLGRSLDSAAAIVDAARTLIGRGVELVVVSMGGDGACFINAAEVVIARPPRITVVSTVGAGDAMVAGIVAAQLEGLSLVECARLASAFSADVISHVGAGLSSRASVEALCAQMTVEQPAI
jgi:1-phosphofructokinase